MPIHSAPVTRGLAIALLALLLVACETNKPDRSRAPNVGDYTAPRAAKVPVVDGNGDDACWGKAPWRPIDQMWLGPEITPQDFSGRYKVVWSPERLYILVEVTDDVLYDEHEDGLNRFWDDDILEIFIDEDYSGGDHKYNHNAFAYHIALDYKVTDLGPDKKAIYHKGHLTGKRKSMGNNRYVWEVGMLIYDDSYDPTRKDNRRVTLKAGKRMGFGIGYIDNDRSETRENFIGTIEIKGEDKNRAYIDASVLGTLDLKE